MEPSQMVDARGGAPIRASRRRVFEATATGLEARIQSDPRLQSVAASVAIVAARHDAASGR